MTEKLLQQWIQSLIGLDSVSGVEWLDQVLTWLNSEIVEWLANWKLDNVTGILETMAKELTDKVDQKHQDWIQKKFDEYASLVQNKTQEIQKELSKNEEQLKNFEEEIEKKKKNETTSEKVEPKEKSTEQKKPEKVEKPKAPKKPKKPKVPTFFDKNRWKIIWIPSLWLLSTVWIWNWDFKNLWSSIGWWFSGLWSWVSWFFKWFGKNLSNFFTMNIKKYIPFLWNNKKE